MTFQLQETLPKRYSHILLLIVLWTLVLFHNSEIAQSHMNHNSGPASRSTKLEHNLLCTRNAAKHKTFVQTLLYTDSFLFYQFPLKTSIFQKCIFNEISIIELTTDVCIRRVWAVTWNFTWFILLNTTTTTNTIR